MNAIAWLEFELAYSDVAVSINMGYAGQLNGSDKAGFGEGQFEVISRSIIILSEVISVNELKLIKLFLNQWILQDVFQ